MTTVAEALAQRRKSTTVAETLAQRDREFETWAVTPPPIDGDKPDMAPPVGYGVRNPRSEPQPGVNDEILRQLQIGTQGVGRGVAGIAGLPVDLTTAAINAGIALPNLAGAEIPYITNPVGGGESIANMAGSAVETALGDVLIDKQDMTPDERLRYAFNQFGTEGAIGGAILSKLAGIMPRGTTAPYEAAGSPARVIAGDTAAGAGSGLAMQAHQEAGSPWGVIGDIILGLTGGVGGAAALRGGEAIATAGRNVARNSRTVPESVISRDPETMLPIMEKDARRAAALYQNEAIDPERASRNIEDYLASVAEPGAPDPTTALIADDPGLLATERRARAADPAPFIERDRAVMGDVSDRVARVRPEGGDPVAARTAAEDIVTTARTSAEGRISRGEAAVSDQKALLDELATSLYSRAGMQDQASRDLDRLLVDETYIPARADKNRLYDDAAADPNVVVGTENVRTRATAARDEIDKSNPALRDTRSRRVADAFTFPEGPETSGTTLPATDTPPTGPRVVRPLEDVMRDRRDLSRTEQEARARGDFGAADTARTVRTGINEDVREAAESGVPGTEKLARADTNYRERFAPFFREGTVAPDFFKKIDSDPKRGSTPPEATANRFLIAGPNSRAAAEDVRRIIEIAPSPDAGIAAVREYVLADAVSKGVVNPTTGRINENQLAAFMNARTGMFDQFPEIKQQFDALLGNVRAGREELSELTAELDDAYRASELTEQQINKGVLSVIADSEPRKAVQAVFAKPDSVAAMRDAMMAFKDNPAAAAGWKAAVADYFTDKVTTASKAAVRNDQDTVSLPALRRTFEQNRDALAEVFSPEEMADLQQVQARLEILSNRGAQAAAGSSTAENVGGVRGVLLDLISPVKSVELFRSGALQAGAAGARMKELVKILPDSDAQAAALIRRAAFDPELARHLLTMPTDGEQLYTWSRKLNQWIVAAETSNEEEAP